MKMTSLEAAALIYAQADRNVSAALDAFRRRHPELNYTPHEERRKHPDYALVFGLIAKSVAAKDKLAEAARKKTKASKAKACRTCG
jgi:hypothetical protein